MVVGLSCSFVVGLVMRVQYVCVLSLAVCDLFIFRIGLRDVFCRLYCTVKDRTGQDNTALWVFCFSHFFVVVGHFIVRSFMTGCVTLQ